MSIKYNNVIEEIQEITQNYVVTLTEIWNTMFDEESCKENLNKLLVHAKDFYEELVEQSVTRRSYIEKEISDLKKEAEDVKRLLKVEVQLPDKITDNLPLILIQRKWDCSLANLREQLQERRKQIFDLLAEQAILCEELGEPPRLLLSDPLPTLSEIECFRSHLNYLHSEKQKVEKKICSMRRDIKKFLDILELELHSEKEKTLLHSHHIKLNKETLENLQRMYDLYGSQVEELKNSIDDIRKKLDTLWERLKTSPNTRSKFRRYADYCQSTYDIIYNEMLRCETLKSQNIKMYVNELRDEIREWWDKTLKSELQRSHFSNFQSTCYTDDLLVLHELELEDLKLYYENNRELFELYADRNTLWDRMQALEAKASEPGRYNNRGGQLLKEEKERKTITTKLPKIEARIRELVDIYEERENAPFLVYGENIIDVMTNQWEQKRLEKEKLSSARKNASKTPFVKSNVSSLMGCSTTTKRAPMTFRNVSSVSSLRKAPSSVDLPAQIKPFASQKRKLNPAEKVTPLAKRSLMRAFNSPSIFVQPSSRGKINTNAAKTSKTAARIKSPLQKNRIIATTIRRQSGRRSANSKKRRSINNNNSVHKHQAPKIIVTEYTTDDSNDTDADNDTYNSFQKCIEPTSRSTILQTSVASSSITDNTRIARLKRMQKLASDENARLYKKKSNKYVSSTKRQNMSHSTSANLTRAAINPASFTTARSGQRSPAICSSGRKLVAKDLPMLI
uniref:Protein regulator of cytokinesis 1 n=1 Tax=Glossina brevipalpis TaxID=37001 RepID=A0A1A9WX51_9MUSC